MSIPTTARGAVLRRAGTLLVAAALVGAPATSALADPTATPTTSTSTTTTATQAGPTVTDSPASTATPTPGGTATGDSTTSPTPTGSATPAPTASNPTSSAPPATMLKGAAPSQLAAAEGASTPQAAYAAAFLARTLAAGEDHYVYPDSGGFPDVGNTIDAILALDAIGAGSDQADASFAFVEAQVKAYTGNAYSSTYAGPTAKALLAVIAHGGDPTSFGGVDLLAELEKTEGAVEPGRFSDLPVDCGYDVCDYSNTIGQSLALIALARLGEPISSAAVGFLLDQQCADGGFTNNPDAASCTSDADATAFAAQALIAAGKADPAADALDWLAGTQRSDGALPSSDGTVNANTTAVAAQAFAAAGGGAELQAAQAFLVSLQYGCSSPVALRGGIAFSVEKRSTRDVADEDLRATPQSALALSGESLLSVERSERATAGTTATPCTTTPTRTPSRTVDPTSSGGSTEAGAGSGPSVPAAPAAPAAPTGSLAQTGSDLLLPALLGLVLVVVGGVAVYVSTRRRGAHS